MKSLKLKKLIAVVVTALTIATVSPIGASAAWKQDSNGWWNTKGNSWSTGWESIDNNWYYFGSNGYMKTGWANDNGTWYYMQPSGAMKTGWINDKGTWYYAATSGAMQTGWVNDGGTWYYTAPSGAMQTGWVNDKGTWYFTAASGAMATGVVEVDGKVYYLAPSGAMATGAVTIGGVTYNFAPSGQAIGDKIPTPTVAFTSGGTAVTPSKPATPTPSKGGSSSGGGGGSHGGGTDYNITSLVPENYTTKLASVFGNKGSVENTGNAIVVTLNDSKLYSLEDAFDAVKDSKTIEAKLDKVDKIMDSSSELLNIGGVPFKEYLAQADNKYETSGGSYDYFDNNGNINEGVIADRIKTEGLTYGKFKEDLAKRVIAMCDENKKAPAVRISDGNFKEEVTKIQKDGNDIYNTSYDINTNINGLVSLGGDTLTKGTYKIYCGSFYFAVVVK